MENQTNIDNTANQKNRPARVSMNYSDKAKKVFYNVYLGVGNSPEDEENAQKMIETFNDPKEGFIAEPIVDRSTGKVEPGTLRVIFPLGNGPEGRVDWNDFLKYLNGGYGEENKKLAMNELFAVVEYYGYTIPQGDKELVESTPLVIESTRKALENANSKNVASMINNFFANLHTPEVQNLLNSVKVNILTKASPF